VTKKTYSTYTIFNDFEAKLINRTNFNLNDLFAEIGGIQALVVLAGVVVNTIFSAVSAKANIASALFWTSQIADTPKTTAERLRWLNSTKRFQLSTFDIFSQSFCCNLCKRKKDA
jgi:hypothetical protein